jgi:hypothetical protein
MAQILKAPPLLLRLIKKKITKLQESHSFEESFMIATKNLENWDFSASKQQLKQKPISDDPYAIIKVDTTKFSKTMGETFWMIMDGGTGECGGIVEMELGTFLDALESNDFIKSLD